MRLCRIFVDSAAVFFPQRRRIFFYALYFSGSRKLQIPGNPHVASQEPGIRQQVTKQMSARPCYFGIYAICDRVGLIFPGFSHVAGFPKLPALRRRSRNYSRKRKAIRQRPLLFRGLRDFPPFRINIPGFRPVAGLSETPMVCCRSRKYGSIDETQAPNRPAILGPRVVFARFGILFSGFRQDAPFPEFPTLRRRSRKGGSKCETRRHRPLRFCGRRGFLADLA